MPKIKVNGINLYYEIHGKGEPLVFVPGFSADHTAFNNILDAYSKRYQVVTVDRRGIGLSDCPDYPYTTEMIADDIAGLAKALNLGPAHFLGHSFGGAVVQNIACKYPDLVRSLTICCFACRISVRGTLYLDTRLELAKSQTPEETATKFVILGCWSEKHLKQPGMAEKLLKAGFFPVNLKGYEHNLHAIKTFDSRGWIHNVRCPVLVIAGDDDMLVSVEDVKDMCSKITDVESHILEDDGHVLYLEQPEKFNRLVLDFLTKQKVNKV